MLFRVESLIILNIPLHIFIRIQGIDLCFMMNKNNKEDTPKILLTQAFEINGPTVIDIPVNKKSTETLRNQVYAVTDVTAAPKECRIDIKSMEYSNH